MTTGLGASVTVLPGTSPAVWTDGDDVLLVGPRIEDAVSVSLGGANADLTPVQTAYRCLLTSDVATGSTLFVPAGEPLEWIVNNPSGGADLTVAVVGTPGLTATVLMGTTSVVFSDGTNVYRT